MDELKLELYWNDIPIGKENAINYTQLRFLWNLCERQVRQKLHELSSYDNGDNYILVRSSSNKGFYRTDDPEEIEIYKNECLRKGKSIFAPVKKINRILREDTEQFTFENNLRVIRESKGLKQAEVCLQLASYDRAIDQAMLSKFENGVCLPTPGQLLKFAEIYGVQPIQLVNSNLYY